MRLIPLAHEEMYLLIPPEEAAQRLAQVTIEPKPLFESKPFLYLNLKNFTFAGSVTSTTFRINKITKQGRNSFSPVLYGRFIPTEQGTLVKVNLILHPVVAAMLIVHCLAFGTFAVIFIGPFVINGFDTGAKILSEHCYNYGNHEGELAYSGSPFFCYIRHVEQGSYHVERIIC